MFDGHSPRRQTIVVYAPRSHNQKKGNMKLSTSTDWISIFIVLVYLCDLFSDCKGQQLQSWPPGDSAYSNVTCIAHDSKFSCDCQNANEYMTLPLLYGDVYQVEISNCKHMTVKANALTNTRGLRTVIFKKVENLILTQNALSFPVLTSNTPLIVEFKEVKIEIIESHAINGNIGEITFIGSTIETIRPFAFTTLKDHSMFFKMDGVRVNSMEPQALKKFTVDLLEIVNSEFLSEVPSKTFYELEILSSLHIQNVTFKKVHTRALSFKGVKKLSVIDTKFDQTESEWITAQIREKALFKGNDFGITSPIAFRAIEVSKDIQFQDRVELHFNNNTVRFQGDAQPLVFNKAIQLHLIRLQYQNSFPCKELDQNQLRTPFYKIHADSIFFQTKKDDQSLALSQIINVDCKERSYLMYIIIGVVAIVLILVIIVTIIILRIINKRKKRKLNVVMPESRTYKETQIIYQIENAGLLKTDL